MYGFMLQELLIWPKNGDISFYPVLVILQRTILRTSTEYVILFGQETKSLFVVRYCSTSLVGEPERGKDFVFLSM